MVGSAASSRIGLRSQKRLNPTGYYALKLSAISMNLSAIPRRSIAKLSVLGLMGALLAGTFAPVLAQSDYRKITIGEAIEPNPIVVRGKSGGKFSAIEIVETENTATGFCNGFIGRKPNHILVLSDFLEYLKLEVASDSDTTIVVQGPGGVWCNDDAETANPAIEGEWQPGKYKIWVGSYQENAKEEYQLSISN